MAAIARVRLHAAIRRGQFHDVRQLVFSGECDLNCRDDDNRTPLILCALIDDEPWGVGIARMLLETGALAGLADKQGRNALHYACIYRRLELVRILLKAVDFDLNYQDRFGNTALFYAASGGDFYIVTSLVKTLKYFRETLDRANRYGMTPLLQACRLGHERVAGILVENGANTECRGIIRRWHPAKWLKEHDMAFRSQNRSYEKPWLFVNSKSNKSQASKSETNLSGNKLESRHQAPSSKALDFNLTRGVTRCSFKHDKTISVLPNMLSFVPDIETWKKERSSKDVIRAKFHPSPAPFCDPNWTPEEDTTSKAHDQWQKNHQTSQLLTGTRWQVEFRQIFKQYENQASKSFRKEAREIPPHYRSHGHTTPRLVHPSIATERRAPYVGRSGSTRSHSALDSRSQMRQLPSLISIDTASSSSRRMIGPNSAIKNGKRILESNIMSDSSAAAKI